MWRHDTVADVYLRVLQRAPARWLWWNQWLAFAVWTAGTALFVWRDTRISGLVVLGTLTYYCLLTGLVEIENYRYRMVLEPFMVMCLVLFLGRVRRLGFRPSE